MGVGYDDIARIFSYFFIYFLSDGIDCTSFETVSY